MNINFDDIDNFDKKAVKDMFSYIQNSGVKLPYFPILSFTMLYPEFTDNNGGIDLNKQDKFGKTALMYAVNLDNLYIVKTLVNYHIEGPVDMNIKDNFGQTALIYAVKNNNLKMVKYLVEEVLNVIEKIDLNIQDNFGQTALIYAAKNNNEDMDLVECLIKNGSDVNIQDNYGQTALMYAVKNNNLKIVECLVGKGAK